MKDSQDDVWPPSWLGWGETDAERRARYIERMNRECEALRERIRRSERLTAADLMVTVNYRD